MLFLMTKLKIIILRMHTKTQQRLNTIYLTICVMISFDLTSKSVYKDANKNKRFQKNHKKLSKKANLS